MSLSQHSMDHATKRALDGTKERTVSVRGRLPPSTTYIPALFLSCRAASAARNPLLLRNRIQRYFAGGTIDKFEA